MLNHSVTFNLGSAKFCSPAISETCFSYQRSKLGFYVPFNSQCFSYHKDVWIVLTYYYIYFYLIVLFPLTVILKLINLTASIF